MRLELKRIDPLRAANVVALVEGLLLAAFALIFLPFFLLAMLIAPSEGLGAVWILLMLVLYPVMGVVFGWISGLLGAAIYNFVIRLSGGFLLEFDNLSS
jgi:hypothetical protein